MADLNHSFDHFAFTSEEKEQLTDRLRQAAEQEERMKEPTKRIIRHTGHRLLIGAGAAAALTMGALVATVGGGLLGYFEARTPEDQSALENGIYRLDRSESWNGWTVALTDCVGDNANSYVWVEVTAPEGTALGDAAALGYDSGYFDLDAKIKPEREDPAGSWGWQVLEVEDPEPGDNRLSFCFEMDVYSAQQLAGGQWDFSIGPLRDVWFTDPGTDQAVRYEDTQLTQAVRDHVWQFSDVRLDIPDQSVQCAPQIEVPYLDGTATLTRLEITPLTTTVRIEGGACYDHHGRAAAKQAGLTPPSPTDPAQWTECWRELETVLVLKDGTTLEPPETGGGSSCQDGVSSDTYQGAPYVEKKFRYAEQRYDVAPQVIDPRQVDYILVCGVRVELPD